MSKLLSLRNKMKLNKPKFQRQDSNIIKQLRGSWRTPKGIHSKLRTGFKSRGAVPSIGYGGPKETKGLTRKGFVPILVSNVKDLEKVDKNSVAVLSHGIGARKRLQILSKAKEMKLIVLGIKDFDACVDKINEGISLRKKVSTTKKDEKQKKVESQEKKEVKQEESKDESQK